MDTDPPAGLVFHTAGFSGTGLFRIFEVWESEGTGNGSGSTTSGSCPQRGHLWNVQVLRRACSSRTNFTTSSRDRTATSRGKQPGGQTDPRPQEGRGTRPPSTRPAERGLRRALGTPSIQHRAWTNR